MVVGWESPQKWVGLEDRQDQTQRNSFNQSRAVFPCYSSKLNLGKRLVFYGRSTTPGFNWRETWFPQRTMRSGCIQSEKCSSWGSQGIPQHGLCCSHGNLVGPVQKLNLRLPCRIPTHGEYNDLVTATYHMDVHIDFFKLWVGEFHAWSFHPMYFPSTDSRSLLMRTSIF